MHEPSPQRGNIADHGMLRASARPVPNSRSTWSVSPDVRDDCSPTLVHVAERALRLLARDRQLRFTKHTH